MDRFAALLTIIAAELSHRGLAGCSENGVVMLREPQLPEIPYHQDEGTWLGLERSTEPTISTKVHPGVGITEEMLIDFGKKGSQR